jgi:hypothetical protein
MPLRTLCSECDKEITQSDDPWARGAWYDEDVLDYDNNGQMCSETGDEHYPIFIINEAQEAPHDLLR